jgi:hypothetical protein
MRSYVGMDVHRKRSQVAIVDDAGVAQRNRNLPNDPAKLVPILGTLPPGTPVAFEAAYGWGWLVELLEELGLEPHLVHPSRCKAIAAARLQERQGRCGHPGPAAARRSAARGLDRTPGNPRPAGAAASPGRPGAVVDLAEEPGACRACRPRDRRGPELVDRSRAGVAGQPPGDRPSAAGPLLPHPQGGPDRHDHWRGPDRARSCFRLSLQHGR